MKPVWIAALGAVLGAALGAGISWAHFGRTPAFEIKDNFVAGSDAPQVVVDNPAHDFGRVERDQKVRHAFRFTNTGGSVLTLRAGTTTCSKCTIAQLTKSKVMPGETVDVIVEYLTSYAQPQFRQRATIITNDPRESMVELYITGSVTTRFRITPDSLVLSRLSSNNGASAEFKVFAYLADSVGIAEHTFTEAETAEFYELTSEPIPPGELTEPRAKSGCRVHLTIKPGLPLGPINQTIRLKLDLGGVVESTDVEVPIQGVVDSDVSIYGGRGWNSDRSRLWIGPVKRSEGATRELFVLVRGDQRKEVQVKPLSVDPSWLKVSVGEPTELKSGTVTQIPLKIEIPPDMPPTNRLESETAQPAEIVLETTHPQARQLRIKVAFVVE